LRKPRLLAGRVFIHVTNGDLLEAEVANRRLSKAAEGGESAYVRAWTSYLQGLIHLQRCEWQAAVEFLERSVAQRFLNHARAAVDSMCGLMLAYQALGQKDEARAALQTLNEYVAPLGDPAMESLAVSAEARLTILQGRLEAGRRWVEAGEPPPVGAFNFWLEIPSITRCRAMLAVGFPGGVVKAEAQLRECAEVVEAGRARQSRPSRPSNGR
jgi:LuxR family maltose regulon positive regulatory protein